MKIAIIGPGAIGSTFAWHLSRAGHDVTVVARGARLRWLTQEGAIVSGDGERATVSVAPSLDTSTVWDFVLVTVLATQVEAVLPTLHSSSARRIMFMFNTFERIDPLRTAVGVERFSFGFPAGVFTLLIDGKIHPQVRPGTTVDDAALAKLFNEIGIPTVVERDMQSWLRSHAALVAPLMSIGVMVYGRGAGVTWKEAATHTRALAAGFAIVRVHGNAILPAFVGLLARLPAVFVTPLFWLLSRTKMLRDLGRLGATEPRMLIDMMNQAAPELAAPLVAIRP